MCASSFSTPSRPLLKIVPDPFFSVLQEQQLGSFTTSTSVERFIANRMKSAYFQLGRHSSLSTFSSFPASPPFLKVLCEMRSSECFSFIPCEVIRLLEFKSLIPFSLYLIHTVINLGQTYATAVKLASFIALLVADFLVHFSLVRCLDDDTMGYCDGACFCA